MHSNYYKMITTFTNFVHQKLQGDNHSTITNQ